ncbi:TPA: lysozyme family protein [Clostridium botulinum]|nr:lysozyme family protein [Clostridium botulinum]
MRTEDYIKQGCKYFVSLLESANAKGCDLNSVIQFYNYGGGFLDYSAEHGKIYTFPLAENSSKMQSDVVLYLSLYISVKRNIIKLWRCYAWIM